MAINTCNMRQLFHLLKNGENDQWMQYQVFFRTSDYSGTATFFDATITYVANASPCVGETVLGPPITCSAATITTSQFENTGNISIVDYPISDAEEAAEDGKVDVQFFYDLGITTSGAGNTGNISVSATASRDITSFYGSARVLIALNDGNGSSQVSVVNSDPFTLDVKNPVGATYPVTVDSTISSPTTNLVISATDDSALQMRFANATNQTTPDCATDLYNTGTSYISYATSYAHYPLLPDSDGVSTVCYEFKDIYNNKTQGSVSTPETPSNTQIADFSSSDLFRLLVWWDPVSDSGSFQRYNIYRSVDDISYSLLSTISNRNTNYCIDEGDGDCVSDNAGALSDSIAYYYRITAEDIDGISSYSVPKTGAQSFGQPGTGTGGTSDTVAPVLSFDEASQGPAIANSSLADTTASVTFSAADDTSPTVFLSVVYEASNTPPESYTNEVANPSMITSGQNGVVSFAGLTPNTTYYFKIKARDNSGNSTESDPYTFTTTSDITLPTVSIAPVVSLGSAGVTITWTASEQIYSKIEYSSTAESDCAEALYDSNTTLTTNFNKDQTTAISSLDPATKYCYRLYMIDSSSNPATDDNSGAGYTFTTLPVNPIIDAESVTLVDVTSTTANITWTTTNVQSCLLYTS